LDLGSLGGVESEGYHNSGIYKIESDNKMYAYAKFEPGVKAYSINKMGSWIYYMKVYENEGKRSVVKTKNNKDGLRCFHCLLLPFPLHTFFGQRKW